MKRREFLISSAGLVGASFCGVAQAASSPCPPGRLSVRGGTQVRNLCAAASGAFEPAITGEPQVEQFLSWDGGGSYGGPNYAYWNKGLWLPWKNRDTGDFTDASGTAQGRQPFAAASVTAAELYYEFDVSTLVQRALSSGQNKGWYMRGAGSGGSVSCMGRTGVNPPRLEVVTSEGRFDCRCQSNANWFRETATRLPVDSRASFKLRSDGYAILRFDLARVRGTITSATMRIFVTERFGTNPVIEVYEADPPTFVLGIGELEPTVGLAAEVGEGSLAAHPDVYMAGDFAGTTFDWGTNRAEVPKLFGRVAVKTGSGTAEVLPDPDAPGTVCWRGSFVPVYTGTDPKREAFNGSMRLMEPDLNDPLCPPRNVVEEAYYRQYVMLEDDFNSEADGNKMGITWDLRMGYWSPAGYWQNVGGNGGDPGDGKRYRRVVQTSSGPVERYVYEGNMQRMEAGIDPGAASPYARVRPWLGYNYNLDQFNADGTVKQPFPSFVAYSNIVNSRLAKGRWYCIEQHLKMNSIDLSDPDEMGNGVARPDGLLETWVNGVLIDRKTGYRWRRHPEMGICQVNANWYMGGRATMTDTMHFRLNHFVLAKRYIGPRVKA